MRLTVQNDIFPCTNRLCSDLGIFEEYGRNTDAVATFIGLLLFAIFAGHCNDDIAYDLVVWLRVMRITSRFMRFSDTNRLGLMPVMHTRRCMSGRWW